MNRELAKKLKEGETELRIAAGLIAVESYLLSKYSDRDLAPLIPFLWDYADKLSKQANLWSCRLLCLEPEVLYAHPSYQAKIQAENPYITQDEYDALTRVIPLSDKILDQLIQYVYEIQAEFCCGGETWIPRYSVNCIRDMEKLFEEAEIPFPDLSSLLALAPLKKRPEWWKEASLLYQKQLSK